MVRTRKRTLQRARIEWDVVTITLAVRSNRPCGSVNLNVSENFHLADGSLASITGLTRRLLPKLDVRLGSGRGTPPRKRTFQCRFPLLFQVSWLSENASHKPGCRVNRQPKHRRPLPSHCTHGVQANGKRTSVLRHGNQANAHVRLGRMRGSDEITVVVTLGG